MRPSLDLEIDRPYSVVAWGTNGAPLAAAIRIWTSDPGVRVLDGLGDPATDPVLPMAIVKERFGEFAIAPAGGDTVQVDREWRDAWIVDCRLSDRRRDPLSSYGRALHPGGPRRGRAVGSRG